nr:site-2 protease family protein [Spirochaetota bacterium]
MSIGYIATMIMGAVVLLGICIFVHELGHLLGGKMVGIKARVFSLGYGKGVLKKQFGDTTYQITLIPFGGYCQFYGDDPTEERKGESYEFLSAHPIKRIVPVIMGPLFNLFLGILIFFMLNLFGYMKESSRVTLVDEFQTNTQQQYVSPASKAGIRTGDRIVEIAGNKIVKFSDIQQVVFFSEGRPLPVKIQRGNELIQTTVNPESAGKQGRYTIGVMPFIKGIRAAGVLDGGAADAAGLQAGDIINTIDGVRAYNPQKFTEYIKSHVGKTLPFMIVRDGREMKVDVTPRLHEEISIQQIRDSKISEDDRVTLGDTEIAALKNDIAAGKVKINGTVVASYQSFLALVEANRSDIITIQQGDTVYKGQARYKSYGFIGIETGVVEDMVEVKYGFGESLGRAFVEPYDFIMMNI